MPDYDFIIAGAGLAGACAAFALSEHGSVLLLERDAPSSGGTGVAAGMVNPILGMRARPVFRIAQALEAFEDLVAATASDDLYDRRPTLRPADGAEQIAWFRETAGDFPEHARWLSSEECADRYPVVEAPDGALLITTGGAIDLPRFVDRILDVTQRRGAEIRLGETIIGWTNDGVTLAGTGTRSGGVTLAGGDTRADGIVQAGGGARADGIVQAGGGARAGGDTRADGIMPAGGDTRITAGTVILALGAGYAVFPELAALRLHRIKGQTIRLSRPPGLPDDLPHLAGHGYVAHEQGGLVAGTTYEHEFEDIRPSSSNTRAILEKAGRMLPALLGADVLDERAGVRVTVPGIRLPMVGPIPEYDRVWIFTGFGAKGLLTAPLAARELPAYIDDPNRIPKETRVR